MKKVPKWKQKMHQEKPSANKTNEAGDNQLALQEKDLQIE
jgi:hypothetical protein